MSSSRAILVHSRKSFSRMDKLQIDASCTLPKPPNDRLDRARPG